MWGHYEKAGLDCYTTQRNEILHREQDLNQLIHLLNNDRETSITNWTNQIYSRTNTSTGQDLPSGIYRLVDIQYENYLAKTTVSHIEEILELSINESILKDFEAFKSSKAVYSSLNLKYKRGVLVYGPPGTGKSSAINKILSNKSLDNVIAIYCSDVLPQAFLDALNKDERLKIIIFEEFTNTLNNRDECDDEMLNFLDGEKSLNNSFTIATTNYPEKLPKNVTDRPGRFDKFYRVNTLESSDILKYLIHFKIYCSSDIINKMVGKTIAEIKEIILIHKRDNATMEQAIIALEKQKDLVNIEFGDIDKEGYIL